MDLENPRTDIHVAVRQYLRSRRADHATRVRPEPSAGATSGPEIRTDPSAPSVAAKPRSRLQAPRDRRAIRRPTMSAPTASSVGGLLAYERAGPASATARVVPEACRPGAELTARLRRGRMGEADESQPAAAVGERPREYARNVRGRNRARQSAGTRFRSGGLAGHHLRPAVVDVEDVGAGVGGVEGVYVDTVRPWNASSISGPARRRWWTSRAPPTSS